MVDKKADILEEFRQTVHTLAALTIRISNWSKADSRTVDTVN